MSKKKTKMTIAGVLTAVAVAGVGAGLTLGIGRAVGWPDWAQKKGEKVVASLFEIDVEDLVKDGKYQKDIDLGYGASNLYESYTLKIEKTDYQIELLSLNISIANEVTTTYTFAENHELKGGPANGHFKVSNCEALYFEITGLNKDAVPVLQTKRVTAHFVENDGVFASYFDTRDLLDFSFSTIENVNVFGIESDQTVVPEVIEEKTDEKDTSSATE